jgi:hypothetical protein
MKHLLTIAFLAILTGCAKEDPAPPSAPPPVFSPSATPPQYNPAGVIPRAPIVFAWGKTTMTGEYSIEYQRGVVTMPGSFQYWGTSRTADTTITVPLPSGVMNQGRWRVKAIALSGEVGNASGWMYFELQ